MNSSYSDLFTGRYFLKREGNEPESHPESNFKLPQSLLMPAGTYVQLPDEGTSL